MVLATRPLTVAETEVSLDAPDSVDMARTFEVTWVGPGAARDDVQIFDPAAKGGEGVVVATKRLRQADFDNRAARLAAPATPGDYELRYYSGESRKVLATRPLTVAATEVTITAPDRVKAGERFTVGWVGPGANRDDIEIVSGDKRVASARVVQGDVDARTVEIKAPDAPGSYELRYYNGDYRTVLASQPITVE